MKIEYRPIGLIHTPFKQRQGMPIQPSRGRGVCGTVEVARRDTLEKQTVQTTDLADKVENLLVAIQSNLYEKALAMRENYTRGVDTYEEFKVAIEEGGFILAHWDGTAETEEKVKQENVYTIFQ